MKTFSSPFDLSTCARPNILRLQPYRCARDDYKDDGSNILLDANENAYGPGLEFGDHAAQGNDAMNGRQGAQVEVDFLGLHRYPDPHQLELKELFCALRNTHVHTSRELRPENLFVGVGSDEVIDALLRCFCTPGHDKILTCPPTYGMYAISAQVNDIDTVQVPLDTASAFALRPAAINQALASDPSIKLVYICSPGNPTASLISKADIQHVLEHPTWNGVVVVDEAYIDFAPDGSSLAEWVTEWPNLVVMQTLSKAFGLAGIRLGTAFTSPEIAVLLNNLRAPYNISSPTSAVARAALQPKSLAVMRSKRAKILKERDRMLHELPQVPGIGRFLGGADANFLLVEILDQRREHGGRPSNRMAVALYQSLAEERGVVVRFRGKEVGCDGCLRITVGTTEEVDRFLQETRKVLAGGFFQRGGGAKTPRDDGENETAANDVIA
ncbi:histidinol-phosphate transaminase [Pseudocyphellaria aurata]|nr:histidinol-phosphate transaminase [Pseudocyphellaria aurata]